MTQEERSLWTYIFQLPAKRYLESYICVCIWMANFEIISRISWRTKWIYILNEITAFTKVWFIQHVSVFSLTRNTESHDIFCVITSQYPMLSGVYMLFMSFSDAICNMCLRFYKTDVSMILHFSILYCHLFSHAMPLLFWTYLCCYK